MRVKPVEGGHYQGVRQRESSHQGDMPRAVNQEDSENDSSITSRMPGQTEQGVEVYKSVCDDMVAPVRENISIFEDEEPVSVAQPQRNIRIIGQSVCDSVVAPVSEKIMIVECEETMGVDQLLIDIVRSGQSVGQVGQSVDIRADNLKSSKVTKGSTLYTNKLIRKYDTSGGNLKNINTLTPIKRKMKISNNSNTMVCILETNLADNPQGERVESPAKRRKCAPEGSVNH